MKVWWSDLREFIARLSSGIFIKFRHTLRRVAEKGVLKMWNGGNFTKQILEQNDETLKLELLRKGTLNCGHDLHKTAQKTEYVKRETFPPSSY